MLERSAELAAIDELLTRAAQGSGGLVVIEGPAAERLTNREIAQSPFVTLKTVEQHLSRSYTKLGIDGRRELAGALSEGRGSIG